MDRRTFIRNSSLASTAWLLPSFLKQFETMAAGSMNEKIFVIVQFSGGNDGLNTIVPYTNDLYYNARTGLAIAANEVVKVGDKQGFHPALQPLQELYDNGWMAVMNSVGYPNPDRSHFRSMDIWQSASDATETVNTGWIGRYLDSNCSGKAGAHTAIEVDDTLSLAMKGATKKGLAVKDISRLYGETREPYFNKLVTDAKPVMLTEDNMGYLYKTIIETYSSAAYVYNTSKLYTDSFTYSNTQFSKQLKSIAQFILSGLNTRVYYVSLGSFDTHVGQRITQQRLLTEFAEGMNAFMKNLKQGGRIDDVLVMTFSEFGRRVNQNASNGTDHGTANNLFLFGSKLKKPGFYNPAPDLSDLDEGDLKYKIDFRNVYATVLQNWLKAPCNEILQKQFEVMNFI